MNIRTDYVPVSSLFKVGGMLAGLPNVTPVGNVGAGEDDLMSYSIPAGTFAANGDTVEFKGMITGAGVDGGTVWLYFGGTQCLSIGAPAGDSRQLFDVLVTRIDSDSVKVSAGSGNDVNGYRSGFVQIDSLNFAAAITFKATGEAISGDDDAVIQETLYGWYWPAN